MKLELKHLAGYLPYGIKMYWEDFEKKPKLPWELKGQYIDFAIENQNKPILRPLSGLTKVIEVNGEKFVPSTLGLNLPLDNLISEEILKLKYTTVQKLLEWHFDIHGLIENGLAIDINTLES